MASELTAKLELQQLEGRIEDALLEIGEARNAFFAMADALGRIRDKKLYKLSHKTWEDYCRQRWGMGRNNADKLIVAREAVRTLGKVLPKMLNAAQAKELIPFKNRPDLQRKILDDAAVRAAGGSLTADMVARAGRSVFDALPAAEQRELIETEEARRRPTGARELGGEGRKERLAQIARLVVRLQKLTAGLGDEAEGALLLICQFQAAVAALE